jgi:hypothetical protein
MRTAEPLTLERSSRRAGAWAWAEGSLYEVLGRWARAAASPAVKLYFDSCSQHHAWRAGLWRDRLAGRLVQAQPGSLPQPPPGLIGPPSRAAQDALAALADLEGTEVRLAAYCRVALPRAAVRYRQWLRGCNPYSDAPVARCIKIALADLQEDWQDGYELLVRLLDQAGGAAVALAAERSGSVESLWSASEFW